MFLRHHWDFYSRKFYQKINQLSPSHYLYLTIFSLIIFGLAVFINQQFFKQAPKRLASFEDDYALSLAFRAGGNGTDIVNDLAIYNDSIYQVGEFTQTAQFGFGYNTISLTASASANGFVAKYNLIGELSWLRQISSDYEVEIKAVSAFQTGVLVAGNFKSVAHFNYQKTDEVNLTSYGNSDIFLFFLNQNGTIVWVKQIGGNGLDQVEDITSDDLYFYLTGRISANSKIDETPLTNGSFLAKINKSDGSLVWVKNISEENSALSFDGTDDYVELSTSNLANIDHALTFSAWIYHNDNGLKNQILNKHNWDDSKGYLLALTATSQIEFRLNNGSCDWENNECSLWSEPIAPRTWTHVTALLEDSKMRLFINNIENSSEASFSGNILNTEVEKLTLGKVSYGLDEYLNGFLDDVRIYNRALSTTEITALYNNQSVDPTGLIIYNNFDDQNPIQATDLSNNNNHGIISGASYFSKNHSALSFDGTDDYVELSTSNLANIDHALTFSAWIYHNDNGLKNQILNKHNWDDSKGYLLALTATSQIEFRLNNGSCDWENNECSLWSEPIAPRTWTHVTALLEDSKMRLFINNIENSSEASFSGNILNTEVEKLTLGKVSYGLDEYLNGFLDDVRIYNRALSTTEITALYNNQSVDPTGLIIYNNFDDQNPIQATDLSNNNNHGIISGASYFSFLGQLQPTSLILYNSNLYQTGYFNQDIVFDSKLRNILNSRGLDDIFITKYDLNGEIIFTNQAGGENDDRSWTTGIDLENQIYMAGSFTQTAQFGQDENEISLTSEGGSDGFLASYDADGLLLWTNKMGGDNSDFNLETVKDLIIDDARNIFITGQYNSNNFSFFDSKNPTSLSLSGNTDIFLASYNYAGNLNWAKNLIGLGNNFINKGLVLDSSKNIYLTGNFSDNLTLGENENQLSLTSSGNTDTFLAKYLKSADQLFNVTGFYDSPVFNLGKNFTLLEEISLKTSGSSIKENTVFSQEDLIAFYQFESTNGDTLINNYTTGPCGDNCNGTLLNFTDLSTQDIYLWSGWTSQKLLLGNSSLILSKQNPATLITIADPIENYLDAKKDFAIQITIKTNDKNFTLIENNSGNGKECTSAGYYFGIDQYGVMEATLHNGTECLIHHQIQTSQENLLVNNDQINHLFWQLNSQNNTSNFYLNGFLVDSQILTINLSDISTSGDIYVGGSNSIGNTNAILDNLAIFNRNLDEMEILANSRKANLSFQMRFSENGSNWTSWQSAEQIIIDNCDQNNFTSDTLNLSNSQNFKTEGIGSLTINPLQATPEGQLEIYQNLNLINLSQYDFLSFKTLSMSPGTNLIVSLQNKTNIQTNFQQQFTTQSPLQLNKLNLIENEQDLDFMIETTYSISQIKSYLNLFEPVVIYEQKDEQFYYLNTYLTNFNFGGDDNNNLLITIAPSNDYNFPPGGFSDQAQLATWQTHYLSLNNKANHYKMNLNYLSLVFNNIANAVFLDDLKAIKNFSPHLEIADCSYSLGLNSQRTSESICQISFPFAYKNNIQYRLLLGTSNNQITSILQYLSFFFQEDPAQHYYSEYPTTLEYDSLISNQLGMHYQTGIYLSDIKNIDGVPEKFHKLKYQASGARTGNGELLASVTDLIALYDFNESDGNKANTKKGLCVNCSITWQNFNNLNLADIANLSGWTKKYALYGISSFMISSYNNANNFGLITNPANNYLDINSDFALTTFIKTSTSSASLVENNNQNGNNCSNEGYYLGVKEGKINFTLHDGNSCLLNIISSQKINDGVWHHIAINVKNKQKVEIYLNGALDGISPLTSTINLETNSPIYLGAKNGVSHSNFIIDALAFYNRDLTADEILANSQKADLYFQTRSGADGEEWQSFMGENPETKLDNFEGFNLSEPLILTPLSQTTTHPNTLTISFSTIDADFYRYCYTNNGSTCIPSTNGDSLTLSELGQYTVCSRAIKNNLVSEIQCSEQNAYIINN